VPAYPVCEHLHLFPCVSVTAERGSAGSCVRDPCSEIRLLLSMQSLHASEATAMIAERALVRFVTDAHTPRSALCDPVSWSYNASGQVAMQVTSPGQAG
jgi:hypothetical protein